VGKRTNTSEELARHGVGAKVRRLRLRKKISLADLGRHTKLSPALLSKLERNEVTPTLPTLIRIALVFGVRLEEFFAGDRPGAQVVRAAERLRFPERAGDPHSGYDFESLDYTTQGRELNAYLAEFRELPVRPHAHDAEEFLHLVSGELVVRVDGIEHRLAAGDSIYIQSSVPHSYAKQGGARCQALIVTTAAAAASVRADK